jgi:SOS-response transcriptional repressor LexA
MTSLTERQQAILDYIRLYLSSHGCSPTTREIQTRFRFASQTSAFSQLHALERKGYIQRRGRRYGLVGPLILWEDVQPLVASLEVLFPNGKTMRDFYTKYPHLKP